jgi:crotonobetainyl-CoA:carnitine CoA-transferase CaiB-like acyl-CoA transferase
MSGLGAISASSQGNAPRFVRPAYADMGTGFLSALAVVTALRHRDRTGEGQRVETSLLNTALALGANILHRFEAFDPPRWEDFSHKLGELRAAGAGFAEQQQLQAEALIGDGRGNIYFRHYRTADGFVSVGCLSPVLYERFRATTGLEGPRQRVDFELDTPQGQTAIDTMVQRAEELFQSRTTAEWIEVLRAGGVPCGRFNFATEVFDDEQIVANDYLIELEHPTLGRYRTFAPPLRMSASPTRAAGPAPLLGAHTDEVLAEAGLGAEEIAELRTAHVAGPRRR